MTALNVQFSDSTQATIIAYFSSPQDPSEYANLGTVDTSDARWKTFYNSLGPIEQEGLPAPTS
jgi:hypothetical protein